MRTNQRQIIEDRVEQTDDETIHHFTTNGLCNRPMHILVVEAIEDVTDQPANEMEPLSDHIAPDALDQLFQPRPNGQPRGDGEVTFPWGEYRVTVTAQKSITIKESA